MSITQQLLGSRFALNRAGAATLKLNRRKAVASKCFSTTALRPIMELTGFTDEQLTVREAVSQVCAQFPNTYWQDHDRNGEDPKDFHAAMAKDGWLGIALPEALGGSGLGTSLPAVFGRSRN